MSEPGGGDLRRLFDQTNARPFREPWEAQVFAVTVELHRAGHFGWDDWARGLADELAAAGPDDDASRYYEHWLAALEKMIVRVGAGSAGDLSSLESAWRDAFEATPHGAPVDLPDDVLAPLRK